MATTGTSGDRGRLVSPAAEEQCVPVQPRAGEGCLAHRAFLKEAQKISLRRNTAGKKNVY